MSDERINILLIEDNAGDARLIGEMLSEAKRPQFDLECVDRLSTGLPRLAAGGVDVVLLDLSLPDSQGFETYVKLHGQDSGVPILVLTGLDDETIAIRAMQEGAQDYLIKGDVTGSMLARAIHYAIERKHVEETLRASEERYRLITENTSDLVMLLDQQGRFTYVSPSCRQVLGYDPAELIGVSGFDLVHPEDLASALEQRPQLASSGAAQLTCRYRHADGSWRWLEARGTVVTHTSSRYTLAVGRDITERKRAEEALRESHARTRAIVDTAIDAIITMDDEGRIVDFNPAAERIFGYRGSEVIGQLLAEVIIPPNLREQHRRGLARYLSTGEESVLGKRIELTGLRADGSLMPVELSISRMPGGGAAQFTGFLRDITERKQAELALQRYTERLKHLREIDQSILLSRSLVEIAQAAVLHISHLIPSTRVALVLIDMAAQTVTLFALQVSGEIRVPPGLQAPIQIIGEAIELLKQGQVYQVTDVAALPELPPALRAARAEHVRAYFYIPIMDDTELIAMLNVGSDQPDAFCAEHVDIAREVANQLSLALQQARMHEQIQRHARELEQRVIARTAELEAANKELEAFSYSVSHDLRAPLRAIEGFSRILLEDYIADLPDEAQHYLQLVGENTQQMGNLIDDLLAFAQLSRQPLNKRGVATADLARQCLEDLHAEQAGRCVEISIGDLPACEGDPTLLKQVWINLIANALKYTRRRDRAVIEIGCQEGDEAIYYVKDNGVGFDMRYVHKLFGVFQRMHRAEDYEGTGVGLAIVQRIVHRHGGRVWAEAEVDRGATFYFTLGGGIA